ncbi:MAG: VWA domain-containing protein [Acidobacteria bacterium]|nr:VWA domain-containing protein [Acidobacteriota bacterium]
MTPIYHTRILAIFLFLFVGSTTTLTQTEDETISVDASIVVVNASVLDASGKPMSGLGQKLFRIFEDGVEQKLELFSSDETPFAAVILLDTSGSMERRVSLARSAAIQFLDGLRADDFVAIYNFDSKVKLVQDFSNSRDIRDQVYDLKADGMTVMNDAVFKAAELLSKREEKRKAIVVLSDGADTMSGKSSEKALQAAIAAGCTIYTVDMSAINDNSVGRRQNQGVLKNFADKTGGKFIATPGGHAMREAFRSIVGEIGVQYTLAYSPTNTKRDGKWRAIEVRVGRPNLTIRTRKGYKAPKK